MSKKGKIKTAIASYGLSGQVFHAPFIHVHDGFELIAICERSKNLAHERYPDSKIVRSFEELLTDDIELVIVNTPDPTHYQFCKKALEAGKNVIVEKPLVFKYEQARELTELAARKGLLLTVYQNRRFDGDFLTLQKIINDGNLGRIVELQSSFQRFRPNLVASTWKETPGTGVGITYNLCSHLCDQALVLFGEPQSIWATVDSQRDGSLIDDYCLMELIYPDHLRVTLRAGMLIKEEAPRFALHGIKGSYVKFGLDPQENALRHNGATPTAEDWCFETEEQWGIINDENGRRKYPTVTGNYMRYYDNIYDCLRNGAQPEVTTCQMLCDVFMLESVFESNRTGNSVKFNI